MQEKFEFPYEHRTGLCGLEILRQGGKAIVIISEIHGRPKGYHLVSVTNSFETIATEVLTKKHKELGDLKLGDIRWVEHYPMGDGREEETYDEVLMDHKAAKTLQMPAQVSRPPPPPGLRFTHPCWWHIKDFKAWKEMRGFA